MNWGKVVESLVGVLSVFLKDRARDRVEPDVKKVRLKKGGRRNVFLFTHNAREMARKHQQELAEKRERDRT